VADGTGEAKARPHISVQGEVVRASGTVFLSRPVLAVGTALVLIGVLQAVPGLARWRLWDRLEPDAPALAAPAPLTKLEVGESRIEQETLARPELAQPEQVALPRSARGPLATQGGGADLPPIDAEQPPVPITDPGQRALEGFYAALRRTERREAGAITRVVHFGDSIIVSDYVSATLRRQLQDRFGDGGHGFMLIANPWPAYFHNDVYRFASSGWLVSRIVGPLASDGLYGLGCVSFRAPPGSRARFGTSRTGKYGRAVARFQVLYYQQPDGGKVQLNLDGQSHSVIDTHGDPRVTSVEIRVPDGAHELELVTVSGTSRLFGVVMEREGPGVVLDAIGIQGARIRFLDQQDDAHWAEQLRWRGANLLVYQFGANESGDGFAYPMPEYYRTMLAVLRQGRQAVPQAGCLVLSAMDRAERRGTQLRSMDVIPALVAEQRRAATDAGCAFFDTFQAMGGPGAMPAWVQRGLGQADLTHPTGSGSEVLGKWIYRALMQGYGEYLKRK
jgi:hypothetical protein